MGKVIALVQQKGGVGKTTTVICLGGALVEQGFKVLLVDLDSQGGLTETLGRKPDTMHHTAVDLLLGYTLSGDAIIRTNLPEMDLIPSHAEVELMERILPNRRNFQTSLKRSLIRYDAYDFVLLDCSPYLGAVTYNALVSADLAILPAIPEYLPIYALRRVISLIKNVQRQFNEKLIYKILLTMVDNRNKVHQDLVGQVHSFFIDNVFDSAIQIDTRLREIILAGLPVAQYAPKTRSALEYRELAKEICCYGREESKN